MKFNFKNQKEINQQYLHDSEFDGYNYDYNLRKIAMVCNDRILGRKIQLEFNNVIYGEIQSCGFWGNGCNSVYDIWTEEDKTQFEKLKGAVDYEGKEYEYSLLTNGTEYIQVMFQLISGDTFFIICEELEWVEEKIREASDVPCVVDDIDDNVCAIKWMESSASTDEQVVEKLWENYLSSKSCSGTE